MTSELSSMTQVYQVPFINVFGYSNVYFMWFWLYLCKYYDPLEIEPHVA